MVDTTHLEISKRIQRQTGRTFHLATRLLPSRLRHPTYVLYAFFRVADDVVDTTDPISPGEQHARLDTIQAAVLGEADTDEPILLAFRDLRERHEISADEVREFLDAMRADIDARGYATMTDLDGYLRGSAVAVAYMMLSVMGASDIDRARPHAKSLGEALQLTNFARDVREDITQYDRIYLPDSVLEAYGVSRSHIAADRIDLGTRRAVAALLRDAEARYRHGVEGIAYLPDDAQFAVLLAATLYAEHHRLIRERGFDVLTERPTLTIRDRATVAVRTWLQWRRHRDPALVFDRVAPVSPEDSPMNDLPRGLSTSARASRVVQSMVKRLDPFGVTK